MRVTVDTTRCEAYGTCADLCPALFQLDEWGYASVVGDGTAKPEDEDDARHAIASCPEKAITAIG
jgi:ferredoxin